MTQEKKARAYDEALERARDFIEKQNPPAFDKDLIGIIFPELKESEDEKIRKTLVELVKCNERSGYTLLNNVSTSSMLTWLEKQCEYDDNIITRDDEILQAISVGLTDIVEDFGWSDFGGIPIEEIQKWLEKQGDDNKPILNVPSREVILSIRDLGNEWKELTHGSISTEYGTQLDYIQKHWYESEYYLKEKQKMEEQQ